MDSTNPIILDISSDEEPDPHGDDHDWLTEILGAVDKISDDSDEVVVVSEMKNDVTAKPQKSKSREPTVDDEDDDDCVVLDGDPDKSVAAVDDDNPAEADDVLVVGQKGQIACRDFPHSRYSCAKYPFNSTPHEKHCDMCHCYVCDTPAPCLYWCLGVSTIDHCHANDKEEIWKSQRQYFKTGKKTALPVSKPHTTTTQNIIRLAAPNSLPQTTAGMWACSSSTGIAGMPNTRTRCRIRRSTSGLNNRGLQPRSRQLIGAAYSGVIRKDRGVRVRSNLGPQYVPSSTISGSPRLVGVSSAANLPGSAPVSHNNNNGIGTHGLQYTQCNSSLASPNTGWPNVSLGVNLEVYTQPNVSQPNISGYLSAMPASPNHVYSQQISQDPNDFTCQNLTNANQFAASETPQATVDCQNQTFKQPGVKDFPGNKMFYDFEDWLLDHQSVQESSLSEPVGFNESAFMFDFETFLNN